MALKRKIYQNLLNWKNSSKGSTAIMIDGARRVGKSYVAEEFAKNEYKSYIIIDFANISPEIEKLFIYERYFELFPSSQMNIADITKTPPKTKLKVSLSSINITPHKAPKKASILSKMLVLFTETYF